MNWTERLLIACASCCLMASGAVAQTNVDSASNTDRDGTVISPEKLTSTDAISTSDLRPARPERQKLPAAVQERIEKFRREARTYLDQQEDLKKRMQGANDKERAALRDKIKQLREQWLNQAREFRKELRQRQQELIDKMPDRREVIESARSAAQQQLQQVKPDARTRRGED